MYSTLFSDSLFKHIVIMIQLAITGRRKHYFVKVRQCTKYKHSLFQQVPKLRAKRFFFKVATGHLLKQYELFKSGFTHMTVQRKNIPEKQGLVMLSGQHHQQHIKQGAHVMGPDRAPLRP